MSQELVRRVTGLLELDAGLPLGALSAPGRGARGLIFGRYLAAHLLVEHFDIQVEDAARLLNRDRSTVTKALKVFRFLEGYTGWRLALETLAGLVQDFVAFGEQRTQAATDIPPPVGRDKKNDALPAWVRERYAVEIEAIGDADAASEARERLATDNIYLSHPAVKAITSDPDLIQLLGEPVVSVTLSPLEDPLLRRPILLVPPEEKTGGAIALRLLVKGGSPSEIRAMMEARASASRALLRQGYRLTGVAESFASRDCDGWRYIPLHIAQVLG